MTKNNDGRKHRRFGRIYEKEKAQPWNLFTQGVRMLYIWIVQNVVKLVLDSFQVRRQKIFMFNLNRLLENISKKVFLGLFR